MAEELRNVYNEDFFTELVTHVKEVYPRFNEQTFTKLIYSGNWQEMTLKQRIRHITICLYESLSLNYEEDLDIIKKVAPHFSGLQGLIFPDFIEVYGLEYWDQSVAALEYVTQFSTAEFAVRPFIIKEEDKMMKQFLQWSHSKNEHVRRLASEGCRPRLPWGMVLTSLKNDPSMIIPILENLKQDESLYVRKSVANNLNDLSKDHPDLVLTLAEKWLGEHQYTDWILKHALRTLLKKGNRRALGLFGFSSNENLLVNEFVVSSSVHMGETLSFSFTLDSIDQKSNKVRVEYTIGFMKANGKRSAKLFQIGEYTVVPNAHKKFEKHYSFKNLSTRKHYEGTHTISIHINGEVKVTEEFDVTS